MSNSSHRPQYNSSITLPRLGVIILIVAIACVCLVYPFYRAWLDDGFMPAVHAYAGPSPWWRIGMITLWTLFLTTALVVYMLVARYFDIKESDRDDGGQ